MKKTNRKRVLLLLPTTTYRAGAFMAAASRLNLNLVVGSDHRQSLAAFVGDTTLFLNFRQPERCLAAIADAHFRAPFDAIIGVDEETVEIAARAAAQIGLPHNPVEAVRAARYKHLFREKLTGAGLPQPKFHLFSGGDSAEKAAAQVDFPCVLKPVHLSASRGVIRADSPAEFKAAWKLLRRFLARPSVKSRSLEFAEVVLVESYLEGKEVAVEGMLRDGRFTVFAIFDKPDPLVGPYFVETIYVTPSRLSAVEQEAIREMTRRAAAALGLTNGPVHAELRLNSRGVWVVELAARSIGGLCSRVLRFEDGQMLEDVLLRQAVNDLPKIPRREAAAAAVMMMPVEKSGVLRSVENVEAARQVTGVEEVIVSIPPNREVQALPEGHQYLGFIFARAEQPQQAEEAVREAFSRLEVRIE